MNNRDLSLALPLMRGADVLRLQRRLHELSFTAVGQPDGLFGPRTRAAVIEFQGSRRLKTDGIVGDRTRSTLFTRQESQTGGGTAPSVDVARGNVAADAPTDKLAWGAKVSPEFRAKVRAIAARLQVNPNHLMAAMAFETGRSFSPSQKNGAGSSAVGLIQFMRNTAKGLGTTTDDLAGMTAVDQLDYVEKYLSRYHGRMHQLSDVYMAILYPAAVGKPEEFVLFSNGTVAYLQNAGLDTDHDHAVTKHEAAAKVEAVLREGLRPENLA